MKKRITALLVALMLIVSLAACSGGGESSGSGSTAESKASSGGAASETGTGGESQTAPGEVKKVIVAMPIWTGAPVDTEKVVAAMNEITVPKLGIEMQFQISDSGSYKQNMTLALSGGETIDIMSTLLADYPSLIRQGYLMDIEQDDLLNTYGSGIIDELGMDNIDGCRAGGVLYGVPNYREFAQGRGCASIATMYLDGIGYTVPDAEEEITKITLAELNDIYTKLHETYPDLEVYRPTTGSMSQFSNVDLLGGSVFGVLMEYGAELKVENLFESDFYMEYCKRMYDYNQMGYISADATTDTTAVGELVKAGTLMSYTTGGKPGIKVQETSLCGTDMTIFQTLEDYISSSSLASFPWVIPENTADAATAMVLLNEFYTNVDLANLIAWGIEGEHYELKDDGMITYPEGVDATNSGWNHSMGWLMPNQLITHIWEGNPSDLWEQIKTFNAEAERSSAVGFTFNSENVMTEMTAVQNVYDEYQKSIEFGMVDPETGIPEMNGKMMNAGLQTIIDEKQAQLDEWAAMQS